MRYRRLTCLVLGVLWTFTLPIGAAERPADLVVLNGKVLTVDAKFSVAEATAIRDGVFVFVGSSADARKLIGEKTQVIDAQGKTVVPGLIESHVHALGAARGEVAQPFVQLGSIAEIQQWVRQQAASTPKGNWIRLPRVDLTRLRERRLPTRAELDAATTQHPVLFNWQYARRQVQILNTTALQAAKITRDTQPPAGGKIVKDEKGEPTGVLENAGSLVAKHIPSKPVSADAALDSLQQLHRRYNELGITSIIERNTSVEGYRTYQKLQAAGRLSLRATMTIGLSSDGTLEGTEKAIKALPVRFGEGDDWVRVGPLKLAVDGGILYGTAYLREPYGLQASPLFGITDAEYRGALSLSAEKVRNMIRAGHRLGWQMCSHVTGDGGVDLVLDAVEAAHRDSPITDRRYTLIHAYFPNPSAVKRAATLGVCVDTQPAWYYKDADALATALGGHRLRSFIGLTDWRHGGVKVAINSDHMNGFDPNLSLNPYNPFLTMYVAVTRKTESGLVIGPEQRVAREDALRMMTIDAAYLSFDEKRKGSIEVGKLGDLAVLSDDLLTCDAERIKDLRALTTVVGGKVVHRSPRAAAGASSASPSRPLAPNGKPYNFVVILADDIGAKELGCYGHPNHKTPCLDRLAGEGMRFRTCYATPLCSPTRVMTMTGRYGCRTGWYNLIGRPGSPVVRDPAYDLGTAEVTFADVLKTRGYATALAGKWQLTGKVPTLIHDCGFDAYRMWAYKNNLPPGVEHTGAWEGVPGKSNTARYWHPSIVENGKYLPTQPTDYGPDLFTDFLIDFMKQHKDRPFCAYFPMPLTHGPHDPVPDRANPRQKLPRGFQNNVECLDYLTGRLIKALDDLGLKENTLVIFTGDNGTAGDGKGTVTELGVRVPLIVRCPGTVKSGLVSDELVDLTDVLPTLADFAGADLPKDRVIDGRSLASVLRTGQGPHREWIFSYLTDQRLLRDKRWLLEGDGRFYDCGNHRDGVKGYKDVTNSQDPEVLAARARFEKVLEGLPAPAYLKGQPTKKPKKVATSLPAVGAGK